MLLSGGVDHGIRHRCGCQRYGCGRLAARPVEGRAERSRSYIKNALSQEKEALEEIARARIAGEITAEEMNSHVDDEKLVMKASLLACRVKGKAIAQKATNAAIKVFTDAVKAALPVI